MDHKHIVLNEGVELTVITDKKFKTEKTYIAFNGGTDKKNAASAALLTGVLTRSCSKYKDLRSLNRALDALYDAHLNSDVMRIGLSHIPIFSISSLCNRYSYDDTDISCGALQLLEDIVTEPYINSSNFDKKVVSGEKEQLCDAINGIKNSRSSYAVRRLLGILMQDNAEFAPRLGYADDVCEIKPTELFSYYRELLSNSTVQIVSVSSADDGRAYKLAERLAKLTGPRKKTNAVRLTSAKTSARGVTEEILPVSQDVICLGCEADIDTSDPHTAASHVLFNEIFSQNPTSRLFENVREKLSLCYYCSALSFTGLKKYIMYAGVDKNNISAAEDEMFRQLQLIKAGVTDDELRRCRLAVKNDIKAASDSPSRAASRYLSTALCGFEQTTDEELISTLDTVTTDDIAELAGRIEFKTTYRIKGTDNE